MVESPTITASEIRLQRFTALAKITFNNHAESAEIQTKQAKLLEFLMSNFKVVFNDTDSITIIS